MFFHPNLNFEFNRMLIFIVIFYIFFFQNPVLIHSNRSVLKLQNHLNLNEFLKLFIFPFMKNQDLSFLYSLCTLPVELSTFSCMISTIYEINQISPLSSGDLKHFINLLPSLIPVQSSSLSNVETYSYYSRILGFFSIIYNEF